MIVRYERCSKASRHGGQAQGSSFQKVVKRAARGVCRRVGAWRGRCKQLLVPVFLMLMGMGWRSML